MTPADIATYMQVSRSTVQRWIKAKLLLPVTAPHPHRRRQYHRFAKADVDALAAALVNQQRGGNDG